MKKLEKITKVYKKTFLTLSVAIVLLCASKEIYMHTQTAQHDSAKKERIDSIFRWTIIASLFMASDAGMVFMFAQTALDQKRRSQTISQNIR